MTKWFRLALAVMGCIAAARAADWKTLPPQGCLSDFAGAVDPAIKARIESYCQAIVESTGVRMALVTLRSLEGEPVADVASSIARGWGLAQPARNPGVLFLLSIDDHHFRLEVPRGLEPALPDGLSANILREMRPALRQQQPGEAVMAAAETLGSGIARSRHVPGGARLPRRLRPGPFDGFPWALAIGSLVLLVWLMKAGGPRSYGSSPHAGFLPWLALGHGLGRSTWGGRGSGGFGGYDSGDSFTGFGGGDFGGAPASSDW